jgi:hypothetical protein
MNNEKQKKEIIRFLDGKGKKEIDVFSLYQWLDRCCYEGWWSLGVGVGTRISPNSLSQDYQKRANYLLRECRIRSDKEGEEIINELKKIIDDIPKNILESYELFKAQKTIFIKALKEYDPNAVIELNWKKLNLANIRERKNWFFVFYPPGWHQSTYTQSGSRKGFGIYFSLCYLRDKTSGKEFARFYAGAESPVKDVHKGKVKAELAAEFKPHIQRLGNIELWPNAGMKKGGKILEYKIPLDNEAELKAVEIYKQLAPSISLIAEKIKSYKDNGYFK